MCKHEQCFHFSVDFCEQRSGEWAQHSIDTVSEHKQLDFEKNGNILSSSAIKTKKNCIIFNENE